MLEPISIQLLYLPKTIGDWSNLNIENLDNVDEETYFKYSLEILYISVLSEWASFANQQINKFYHCGLFVNHCLLLSFTLTET